MAGTAVQHRRGTAAQWAAANPVLPDGELGYEKDTGIVKMGNGTSTWNQLQPILGSSYLPILGKAADSERLDGLDSTAFVLASSVSETATPSSIANRTSDGRLVVADGVAVTEAATVGQIAAMGRDRGIVAAMPSAASSRRGDVVLYSPRALTDGAVPAGTVGNLWDFDGAAWRARGNSIHVTNAAERDLYNTTLAYDGLRAQTLDNDVEWIWTGVAGSTNLWRTSSIGGITYAKGPPSGMTIPAPKDSVAPKLWVAKLEMVWANISYCLVAIQYPPGFFTEIPAVQVTYAVENSFSVYGGTDQHTTSGCTAIMRASVNISATQPEALHVIAIGR